MSERQGAIHRLFNIRKEEAGITGLFFFHHFFLGIGLSLVFTSVSTFFLTHFSVTQLPWVFIIAAGAIMVTGKIYSVLEHKFSPLKFMPSIILFISILTLLFRFQYEAAVSISLAFFLIVGYRLIYLLCNLEFWGLSSLVFDVRQSKRLFSLISSGDVPAKLLGYLSVSVLVPLIGLQNLLIPASVAFICSYFMLKKILKRVPIEHHHHEKTHAHHTHKGGGVLKTFFMNDLISTLALMAFLVAIIFNLIDYTFLSQVQQRYHSQEDLASFLGVFFAVGYFLTIVTKLLITGRLAEKAGVAKSLLLLPAVLLCYSVIFLWVGSKDVTRFDNLAYIGILFMTLNVIKSSINEPVFLVTFQPLPPQLRLHGHTVIKGFVEPIALALTGVLLLTELKIDGNVNYYYLNFGVLVIIGVWMWVVFRVRDRYVASLRKAINKRFITGSDIGIRDEEYYNIIEKKLTENDPANVSYAISALEEEQPELIRKHMHKLLKSDSPVVIGKCIQIAIKNGWKEFLDLIADLITDEQEGSIKKLAIRACAEFSEGTENSVTKFLNSNDTILRLPALHALVSINDHPLQQRVRDEVLSMVNSDDLSMRMEAIDIITTSGDDYFAGTINKLMDDHDPEIIRMAIVAAGEVRNEQMMVRLLDFLQNNLFTKQCIASLSLYGKTAIRALMDRKVFFEDIDLCLTAARLASITPGGASEVLLLELLSNNDMRVRSAAVKGLKALDFAPDHYSEVLLHKLLTDEFRVIYFLLRTETVQVKDTPLIAAYKYEWINSCERIFDILELLYDKDIIHHAYLAITNPNREKRANAIEALENVVNDKIHEQLIQVFDDLPLSTKLEKLIRFESPDLKGDHREVVLKCGYHYFNLWTITCALREQEISERSLTLLGPYVHSKQLLFRQIVRTRFMNLSTDNHQLYQLLKEKYHLNTEVEMKENTSSISEIEKLIALKGTRLFANTPENIIAEIISIVREQHLVANQTIFNKGDEGSSMYIIFEGEIRIHDSGKTLAVLHKGDFFGELALLDPEPRSASATAIKEAVLLKLDEDEAYELMEERTEVLKSILRILCRIIRGQNQMLISKD